MQVTNCPRWVYFPLLLGFIIYWQKYSCIVWSFGIEYIPQEVLNKIRDKLITHNIYRIQDSNSVMCGFYCIAFIEYMIPEKTLLDYTNLFFPSDYKNNDNIINKYFKDKYVKSGVKK